MKVYVPPWKIGLRHRLSARVASKPGIGDRPSLSEIAMPILRHRRITLVVRKTREDDRALLPIPSLSGFPQRCQSTRRRQRDERLLCLAETINPADLCHPSSNRGVVQSLLALNDDRRAFVQP